MGDRDGTGGLAIIGSVPLLNEIVFTVDEGAKDARGRWRAISVEVVDIFTSSARAVRLDAPNGEKR